MNQLKGYLEQLRSLLPPEPGKVQSVDGEGFTDNRLGYDEWGPFKSHGASSNKGETDPGVPFGYAFFDIISSVFTSL